MIMMNPWLADFHAISPPNWKLTVVPKHPHPMVHPYIHHDHHGCCGGWGPLSCAAASQRGALICCRCWENHWLSWRSAPTNMFSLNRNHRVSRWNPWKSDHVFKEITVFHGEIGAINSILASRHQLPYNLHLSRGAEAGPTGHWRPTPSAPWS